MKNKRIDELEAKVDHIQDRLDYFIDKAGRLTPNGEYYFTKFEDLLSWSQKFDANSKEYEILTQASWQMLEHYLNYVLPKAFGGKE